MKLILIRHGKDADGYRGGWSLCDLTEEGKGQAMRLAEHLATNKSGLHIDKILSSDLPRALSTARILADRLSVPLETDTRLREMNQGALSGMANKEAEARYPHLYFNTLDMDDRYPNGESPREFYERIRLWFEGFLAEFDKKGGTLAIVTHGGVINILYHIVMGKEWSNKAKPFPCEHGSLHILETAHLQFEVENRRLY